MRELLLHILIWCLMRVPQEEVMHSDGAINRTCFCGEVFKGNFLYNGEGMLRNLKEHITGRDNPGVKTANITMEDINGWMCYFDRVMGVKEINR